MVSVISMGTTTKVPDPRIAVLRPMASPSTANANVRAMVEGV
jgi:hypothetical protein